MAPGKDPHYPPGSTAAQREAWDGLLEAIAVGLIEVCSDDDGHLFARLLSGRIVGVKPEHVPHLKAWLNENLERRWLVDA